MPAIDVVRLNHSMALLPDRSYSVSGLRYHNLCLRPQLSARSRLGARVNGDAVSGDSAVTLRDAACTAADHTGGAKRNTTEG